MDSRFEKLARLFLDHSVRLQKGDVAIVESIDAVPSEMVIALVRGIRNRGGHPIVWTRQEAILRECLLNAQPEELTVMSRAALLQMECASVYIGLRGAANISELADVPQGKMALYTELFVKPVHFERRVNHTRWVITRWPTPSMAQLAGMSTDAFTDFFFRACTGVDYAKMSEAMDALVERMQRTDRVTIVGPDMELSFSIKGIPAVKCAGTHNVPDGEVFTAPVLGSINGVIRFNTPTIYEGKSFSNITLSFHDGCVTDAACESGDKHALSALLDRDAGARFVGEFAIAMNPMIQKPIRDILFDEKIAGSIHFALGNAYETADNGNKSVIHWDLVLMQRLEDGGGAIYFDDVAIRRNGLFVVPELEGLNPEKFAVASV